LQAGDSRNHSNNQPPNLFLCKMSFDYFTQDPLGGPVPVLLDQGTTMQPPSSKFYNNRQHTKARVENANLACIPDVSCHLQ
jgi:hypothetical protein